jgi:capsular exopolysaccharide synthesis family protein
VEAVEYFRALRRRWKIVAAFVVVAMAAAWFTSGSTDADASTQPYEATTTMWSTGTSSISGGQSRATPGLETLAALVTVGEVPERVAETIDREGEGTELASKIVAEADDKTGFLTITATSNDREEAGLLAITFANELIGLMKEEANAGNSQDAKDIRAEMNQLEAEIVALESRIASGDGSEAVLGEQLESKENSYGVLSDQLQQLTSGAVVNVGLEVVEEGEPKIADVAGFQAPRSRNVRLVLAAILGLLFGVGAVLVLEHLDQRIKDKEEVEHEFHLPVLAEIPVMSRKQRKGIALETDGVREPVGDAFRFLTAALSLSSAVRMSETGSESEDHNLDKMSGSREEAPRVILVTSSAPTEGKTTVVVNLAAAFAELGQKVIIFSCDFQRPQAHTILDVDNDSGLVDALTGDSKGPLLNGYVKDTEIKNVRLVPSGSNAKNSGELLSSREMQAAISEAREMADVVLIDTAPLLAAGEATLLFSEIDGVLVVSRAGRTTPDAAGRARDLLMRLDAPMLGVVLNAAEGSGVPYYYYPLRERRRGFARLSRD